MNKTLRYDVLNNETSYIKKKLIETKLFNS